MLQKNSHILPDTLSRRTYFWDTAVPLGSENSHSVVQLNPDEDKNYLLTPYPTLMPSLKKLKRYTTSHPHTNISRTPHKNGHNTKTIHRPKFTKTCRNRKIFRHLHTRLQWIL